MKKTFIFYSDRIDYTEWMTNEEKGILFQTILDYQNWKDITNDNIVIRMLFPRIKKQLDDDNKKRLEEKESRSKAWKLWMEKRWNKNNSVITNDNSVIKSITKITDNVNVNDNVNVILNKLKELWRLEKKYPNIDMDRLEIKIIEMISRCESNKRKTKDWKLFAWRWLDKEPYKKVVVKKSDEDIRK